MNDGDERRGTTSAVSLDEGETRPAQGIDDAETRTKTTTGLQRHT